MRWIWSLFWCGCRCSLRLPGNRAGDKACTVRLVASTDKLIFMHPADHVRLRDDHAMPASGLSIGAHLTAFFHDADGWRLVPRILMDGESRLGINHRRRACGSVDATRRHGAQCSGWCGHDNLICGAGRGGGLDCCLLYRLLRCGCHNGRRWTRHRADGSAIILRPRLVLGGLVLGCFAGDGRLWLGSRR